MPTETIVLTALYLMAALFAWPLCRAASKKTP